MTSRYRLAALLGGLFFAFHVPFLPASLEDLDSINFALGIRDFDVARHQPHPPGYPVFIAAAKALHAVGLSEVRSLSLLGVVAGSFGLIALVALFAAFDRDQPPGVPPWMAAGIVATCPLYWLTAARPLSDMMGLVASMAVQALILTVTGAGGLAVAGFCAGLAAGIRSQVVWLALPVLALRALSLPRAARVRGFSMAVAGCGAGAMLWLVPLLIVSGGPRTYWQAFFNQGAEDLSGVAMLATTPTLRQLAKALQYTFVAPWGYWQAATLVLVLAGVGLFRMWQQRSHALLVLAAGFGPYLVFDLLFQETITTRYALPAVVPIAYLAVRGAAALPRTPALVTAAAIALFSMTADDGLLPGYAGMQAPAFRMLDDMRVAVGAAGTSFRPPVLAMHRREEFDMRRPIQWVGERMPPVAERLPSPPKHEWLEMVKYWNRGGRAPVWVVADPLRSDLALFRPQRQPTLYRWPFALTALIGGVRPNETDWHRVEPPDWYLGEGWSVTPETAGIAAEDRRGPGYGPISGWIRRWPGPATVMMGGRNLSAGGTPARVRVAVDGAPVDEASVPPGFFLRTIALPSLAGEGDYAMVTVQSDSANLAIEQFDAQPAGRVMYGFGEGWHEQEYNPSTGALWRWMGDRAVIRVRAEGHAAALTLRGEIEAAPTSHVVIRAGDRVVAEFDASRSFARTVLIPADSLGAPESAIVLETSASYVPADRRWSRSRDRRRLGLKLYECRVTQVS